MMRKVIYVLVMVSAFSAVEMSAQVDRREVRRGNRDFKRENYKEADIDYRKAVVKDSLSVAANYNLANTLYRQGDYEQAAKVLENVKDEASASVHAADYHFNVGDAAIAGKNWQAAVDAFRESLLKNPDDVSAKENYIYARKMLENQQQQQQQQQDDRQNQDQNQDKDQDQNKDQDRDENKDKNQDQNQDKNQDNDQNQDRDKDKDQNDGQNPKITPQAAQQMLQAIQAKEKETQDKVNREKAQAMKSRQKEKNW